MALHILSDDDIKFIKDLRRREELKPKNEGGTPPQKPTVYNGSKSYIGKVNESLSAGAVTSGTAMFQALNGPAHSVPDGTIASPFAPDYVWVDVAVGQWVVCYDWKGKWYISPLDCNT